MEKPVTEDFQSEVNKAEQAHRAWRMLKDRLFGWTMAVGGLAVIGALLTIFIYLLWVVFPLFRGATLTPVQGAPTLALPADPQHLSLDERGDLAFAIGGDGQYRFLSLADGSVRAEGKLLPAGARLVAGLDGTRTHGPVPLALKDGRVLVVKPTYQPTFDNNVRGVKPGLAWPVGREPLGILPRGADITAVAAASGGDITTVAAVGNDGALALASIAPAAGLQLDPENTSYETTTTPVTTLETAVEWLLIDNDQQRLFAVSRNGTAVLFDIRDKAAPRQVQTVQVVPPGVEVTSARLLAGGHSLLVGDSRGRVAQWFTVRDAPNNLRLERIRKFDGLDAPIRRIEPEHFRKGLAAIDATGRLALYHTTSERTLLTAATGLEDAALLAYSGRANALLALDGAGRALGWRVENRHPEVSLHSLWARVWYEGREAPEFIWQSSSASSDFEPKFSLTPLVYGTIKAAFYALFFAIPIAIGGAIYTAYFMHPRLRAVVKPSIETMAALPTVILGFLAGLWLAPLIESHLLGVLMVSILLPISVVVLSATLQVLPARIHALVPPGREVLVLVPWLALVLWGTMALSQPVEQLFFDGNLPRWLKDTFGWTYDQRNSLVVGIAMGFAVIPNIFSISEDAVFGVPRQLTTGSLALGATPWQTMSRVVLLTASPGIFSAVMIGLGRAVGETMIVLMSTGNTPVMDFSIFQGFRALSANIAVEMPESEVNSTHYRVLFLAALVLFATTFVFNTIAEVVRQRLRRRYGNL